MFNIKNIAVDFDQTLCMNEKNYPVCAYPSNGFKVLIDFQALGGKVILWTCREGHALEMAHNFCIENGLTPDAINEQLPEQVQQGKMQGFACTSRKIFADMYIDDKNPRSLATGIDWDFIRYAIINNNAAVKAA